MPKEEALEQYSRFTPEAEQMMRGELGDEPVDNYVEQMEKLWRGNGRKEADSL